MRAFDQTRNVRQHEFTAIDVNDPELWMKRSERIVRDLRLGGADGCQEGRLTSVRQTDEACVRDQFQPQPDPAFLALLARIGVARRAIGRGLEVRVAKTAIAAFGDHEFFAKLGEVVDKCFTIFIEHLRAHRHLEDDRLAIGPVAVLAHAVGALLGFEVLLIAIVDQRIQSIDGFDHHVTAAPAIAAARAAELDIFLAAKRHAAVAAVAGADIDLCFIKEFHG